MTCRAAATWMVSIILGLMWLATVITVMQGTRIVALAGLLQLMSVGLSAANCMARFVFPMLSVWYYC
ncbi:hypothetical protein L211DRAFT_837420 [Terfezia boudieri ATCC MYA-4762]|uniref:Uncharacterized protein n=1 Tax=Terfezia boudieri ATCC MYA-4762 TaxID=1051890 RepID=A0A3N4LV32_9PEZI|nr:hypothetical protein L211DRAFT_837420 [Terfezia boudieri ATCC MYA-4762]